MVKISDTNTVITGNLSMSSQSITNLANPSSLQDAATKYYVDLTTANILVKAPCVTATTGSNLSASYSNGDAGVGATLTSASNGALTIDGVSLNVSDRVLIKDQTDQTQNGIYTVTNTGSMSSEWVLTRATDTDNSEAGSVRGCILVFIEQGSVNADNGYLLTSPYGIAVIGTDDLVWSKFSGNAYVADGTTLTLSGETFSINTSYSGQSSITTVGTITTGTWNATTLNIAHGGTGGTTVNSALNNLGLGASNNPNFNGLSLTSISNGIVTITGNVLGSVTTSSLLHAANNLNDVSSVNAALNNLGLGASNNPNFNGLSLTSISNGIVTITSNVLGSVTTSSLLHAANNLNDVSSVNSALNNLGLGASNNPNFNGLTLGGLSTSGFVTISSGTLNSVSNSAALNNLGLGTSNNPNFNGLTLGGLSTSGIVTITSGVLNSVSNSTILHASNNLNDVSDVNTALNNLGLGASNNPTFNGLTLDGLSTNGIVTVSSGVLSSATTSTLLHAANNLNDVANVNTALNNLGLGTSNNPNFNGLTLGGLSTTGFVTISSGVLNSVSNSAALNDLGLGTSNNPNFNGLTLGGLSTSGFVTISSGMLNSVSNSAALNDLGLGTSNNPNFNGLTLGGLSTSGFVTISSGMLNSVSNSAALNDLGLGTSNNPNFNGLTLGGLSTTGFVTISSGVLNSVSNSAALNDLGLGTSNNPNFNGLTLGGLSTNGFVTISSGMLNSVSNSAALNDLGLGTSNNPNFNGLTLGSLTSDGLVTSVSGVFGTIATSSGSNGYVLTLSGDTIEWAASGGGGGGGGGAFSNSSQTYGVDTCNLIQENGSNNVLQLSGSTVAHYTTFVSSMATHTYTLSIIDNILGVDTSAPYPATLTLPSQGTVGFPTGLTYTIVDIGGAAGTANITIQPGAGDSIKGYDGIDGYTINISLGSVTIVYAGSNVWNIISTGNEIGGLTTGTVPVATDGGTALVDGSITCDDGLITLGENTTVNGNFALLYQGGQVNQNYPIHFAIISGTIVGISTQDTSNGGNAAVFNTFMLPAMSTLPTGTILVIKDENGTANTTTHIITIWPNNTSPFGTGDGAIATDSINGQQSPIYITSSYGSVVLYAAGAGNWYTMTYQSPQDVSDTATPTFASVQLSDLSSGIVLSSSGSLSALSITSTNGDVLAYTGGTLGWSSNYLQATNNLSDVSSASTAAGNLGLGTTSNVTFGGLTVGSTGLTVNGLTTLTDPTISSGGLFVGSSIYNTGTVSTSGVASYTIAGTGTSFTANMVGGVLYAAGTTCVITAVSGGTTLIASTQVTLTGDCPFTLYYNGIQSAGPTMGLSPAVGLPTVYSIGGVISNRTAVSSSYALTATDYIVGVTSSTASIVITLPDPSVCPPGTTYKIKDESGNAETYPIEFITAGNSSVMIDGGTINTSGGSSIINTNYGFVTLYYAGMGQWYTC